MINFSDIELVIFDLQQTLLDDYQAHMRAHKTIIKEIGSEDIDSDLKEIKRLWGMRVFDVYKKLFGDRFTDDEIQNLVEKRDIYYVETFSSSKAVLCKGAKKILRYLKEHDFPIAVVSGIRKDLVEIGLSKSGLAKYVDYLVGAEDIERGKPNPDSFLKAASHFNIRPEHCLVVGDSFLDMEAARNGDMIAVGISTGFTSKSRLLESGARFVYSNLDEFYIDVRKSLLD